MERQVFACLLLLFVKLHLVNCVTVTEVEAGHLAELPCLSIDDNHRFMFWQLTDDHDIIGPGNSLDHNKYNYEVLTGKLLIRVIFLPFFFHTSFISHLNNQIIVENFYPSIDKITLYCYL